MKKKILIIHPGIGPYRTQFFETLSRQIPIHLFLYFKSTIAHLTDASSLNFGERSSFEFCIKERQTKWRPVHTFFRIGPRIVHAFFSQRPAAVVVSEYSPISAVAAVLGRLVGSKIILWTDDSMDNAENISQIRKIQRGLLFALSDRLIVINPTVSQYYQTLFRGEIFTSLLLQPEEYIRQQLFAGSVELQAKELLSRHSLAGTKVLLFAGRLSPEKNLAFFLECFSRVVAYSEQKLRLVLIGSGPEEDSLRALAEKLGIRGEVIFTGYLSRDGALWGWFRLAGLVAFPSLRERFGAVVNESLICGVPVLCSSRAGSSCLIENTEMGEVFDPEDGEQFLQILLNRLDQCGAAEECLQKQRPSLMEHHFYDAVEQFVAACT